MLHLGFVTYLNLYYSKYFHKMSWDLIELFPFIY